MATGDVADCSAACDDYFTQVCGSDDDSVYAVYDVGEYWLCAREMSANEKNSVL